MNQMKILELLLLLFFLMINRLLDLIPSKSQEGNAMIFTNLTCLNCGLQQPMFRKKRKFMEKLFHHNQYRVVCSCCRAHHYVDRYSRKLTLIEPKAMPQQPIPLQV